MATPNSTPIYTTLTDVTLGAAHRTSLIIQGSQDYL